MIFGGEGRSWSVTVAVLLLATSMASAFWPANERDSSRSNYSGTSGPSMPLELTQFAFLESDIGFILNPRTMVANGYIVTQGSTGIHCFREPDGSVIIEGYWAAEHAWSHDISQYGQFAATVDSPAIVGSTLVHGYETLYGQPGGAAVFGFDIADGTQRWKVELPEANGLEIVVGNAGVFYILWMEDYLTEEVTYYLAAYRIADGSQYWQVEVPENQVGFSYLIQHGATLVHIEHLAETVVAHRTSDGSEKWRYLIPNDPDSSSLSPHDILAVRQKVVVVNGHLVTVLDADTGEKVWDVTIPKMGSCETPAFAQTKLASDGDYLVVANVCDEVLVVLDMSDGSEVWRDTIGFQGGLKDNVIIAGGTVYAFCFRDFTEVIVAYDLATGEFLGDTEDPLLVNGARIYNMAVSNGLLHVRGTTSTGPLVGIFDRQQADLSVELIDQPFLCDSMTGAALTYEYRVRNHGPGPVNDITLDFRLPATDVQITTDAGTCIGKSCELGSLGSGEQVLVTLTATPTANGPFNVTATVDGDAPDRNPDNNRSISDTFEVLAAPDGGVDIEVTGLEVTQGIQNLANDVPLMAGKPTLVRVYVRSNATVPRIVARLYGEDEMGAPLSSLSPVVLGGDNECLALGQGESIREDIGSTINFVVPARWRREGRVTLRVEVEPAGGIPDATPGNNSMEITRSFIRNNPVCLKTYTVRTENSAGQDLYPSALIASDIMERAESVFPASNIHVYPQSGVLEELEITGWGPYELNDDDMDDAKILHTLWWHDQTSANARVCREAGARTLYMGAVDPNTRGIGTLGGMATIGLDQLFVVLRGPDSNRPMNSPLGGRILSHEIGHNFGRKHVDCGGPKGIDDNYPYNTCQLGPIDAAAYYATDLMDYDNPLVGAPSDFGDLMSYAFQRWPSDYFWRRISADLHCQGVSGLCVYPPNPLRGDSIVVEDEDGATPARSLRVDEPILLVSGLISPEGALEIETMYLFGGGTLPDESIEQLEAARRKARRGIAPYELRLVDSGGATLATEPFEPFETADGESGATAFGIGVPWDGSAAELQIVENGSPVASRAVSANAPVVNILMPSGAGILIEEQLDIVWEASDADGDDMTYLVQFSSDFGANWTTIGFALVDTMHSVAADLLPGAADTCLLRVIASDGVLTGMAMSDPFSMTAKAPFVEISSPADNHTYNPGDLIVLKGRAFDPEDEILADEELSWSLDGGTAFDTGTEVFLTGLEPGTYTVTLTATDSDAMTGTDQITIHVREADRTRRVNAYSFDLDAEGWFFQSPAYTAPLHSEDAGRLKLLANNDNTGTFGYYVTFHGVVLDDFDPMADPSQSGDLHERQGPHYLARFYIRRTTADPAKAPALRLRANASNFEDYHTLVINSPENPPTVVPGFDKPTAVDMVFQPHPYMYNLPTQERWYYLAMDLISFLPEDDPNGGYELERVDVYRFPLHAVETVAAVKSYDFTTGEQAGDWATFSFEPTFAAAEFESLPGELTLAIPEPDPAMGTWQTLPFTVMADWQNYTGKLFVRMRCVVTADEANAYKVPWMRFRLAPHEFSHVAVHGLYDLNSATFTPSGGAERVVYTYMEVPPAVASPWGVHLAWDALSFEEFATEEDRAQFQTSPEKVRLHRVDVDLVRLVGYPIPSSEP